jgi:hypothetical protein
VNLSLHLTKIGIFLKFDHFIYENDTPPFGKGGSRGIFQVDSILNPPWPPFFKGGNPFEFNKDFVPIGKGDPNVAFQHVRFDALCLPGLLCASI